MMKNQKVKKSVTQKESKKVKEHLDTELNQEDLNQISGGTQARSNVTKASIETSKAVARNIGS